MSFSDVVDVADEENDILPLNKVQKLQAELYKEPKIELNCTPCSRTCQSYCTSALICIGFLFVPLIILIAALHIHFQLIG